MSSDRTVSSKPQPEPTPAQQAETLEQEITAYLAQGGLFNPEMAQHNNVCDLLMRCRDVVAALRAAVSPQALAQLAVSRVMGERLLEWQRRAEAAEAALNAHLCEHDAADWLACSHQHVSTCAVCRLAEAEAEIARLREVFRMCRNILGY